MDNSNENRPEINFEELLKKIESEQNTVQPDTVEEKTAEEKPMLEDDELAVPKKKEGFTINIKDDDFAGDSKDEVVRVDTFSKPRASVPIEDEADDEFATKNIDLERELRKEREIEKVKTIISAQ